MNHRLVSAIFVYKKLLLVAMLVIFSLLVGACGAVEQDVTLIKNEKWKAETRLILNKQTIALANPADIEQRLDAAQAQADAAEVSYKWNKKINDDGGVTYIIGHPGRGMISLTISSLMVERSSTYWMKRARLNFRFHRSVTSVTINSFFMLERCWRLTALFPVKGTFHGMAWDCRCMP